MMASCENGLASGFINATYSDNSTSSSPVLVPAWWSWPYPAGADIILPYSYTNQTINYNKSMVYQTINWIDSTKELVSLTLPNVTAGSNSSPGGAAVKIRLHIFSLSVLPAIGSATDLEIQFARTVGEQHNFGYPAQIRRRLWKSSSIMLVPSEFLLITVSRWRYPLLD
jgi:alpha-L-fucosidase